jgi:hypothetical protein
VSEIARERLSKFAHWLETTQGAVISSLSYAYQPATLAPEEGMTFQDAVKLLVEDIRTVVSGDA